MQVSIATANQTEARALRSRLPEGMTLKLLGRADLQRQVAVPNALILDLAHPPGSEDDILTCLYEFGGQARSERKMPVILMAADVSQVERLSLGHANVERVIKHPRRRAGFRKLADYLSYLIDADSYKKFLSVSYDGARETFEMVFRDGELRRLPVGKMKSLDGSGVASVHVLKSGYEFEIKEESGKRTIVPWDLIFYHCDPGYRYYQRKENPSLADRIARNVKALRRKRSMTSYELAELTGIKRPNIARIENARTAPSLATLEKVAEALRVPLVALLES